jgi:glycosyltransferase involved in cell wall biosynthesis
MSKIEKQSILDRSKIEAKVLFLLPAHNEERTITSTIRDIQRVNPKATIVVIDNASTDATAQLALEHGAIVVPELRLGKGFAVQRGFDFAVKERADVVVLLDADATYGVDQLPEAIKLVSSLGVDMVVGTRNPRTRTTDLQTDKHFRLGHRTGNKIFTKVAALLLPAGINDVLSGWRAMSLPFVQSFPGGSKGFEIEAQLNSHAYNINAHVENVDIDYFPRPTGSESKLNTYQDGVRILRTTLKNFRNDRPLLAFSLLATPWLITSAVLFYLPLKTYVETGLVPYLPRLVAGVGTFLISSLLWASGLILERIRDLKVQFMLSQYHAARSNSH